MILTERKQMMTFPCADIKNPWPLSMGFSFSVLNTIEVIEHLQLEAMIAFFISEEEILNSIK